MAIENRTTLKGHFETGDIPTQAQFEDLIDSLSHLTDDIISQSDAESGTSTDGKVWTAQRVAQAIAALGNSSGGDNIDLAIPFVWLIRFRGQSNALGEGVNTDLSAEYLDAFTNTFIWNESNSQFEALLIGTNNEGGQPTEHGPEAELAQLLETNYPTQDFYLLKTAIGGRDIDNLLSGASGDPTSVFIKDRDQTINAVNALLADGKYPCLIDLFIQGESDTGSESEAYAYNDKWDEYHTMSIGQVGIDLPIIVAEIGDFTAERIIINQTLAFQSKVKSNVLMIKSGGYERLSAGDSHFTAAGQALIGTDFYNIMKSGLVKPAPVFTDLPIEQPTGVISSDSYQLLLDFATVEGYGLPSASQQTAHIQLIADLKAAGAWDRLDGMYIPRQDGSEDFGYINWKSPVIADLLVKTGAVSYVSDVGSKGDGATGFLTLPVSILSNYAATDAGFLMDITVASGDGVFDVGTSGVSSGIIVTSASSGNTVFSRINSTSNGSTANGGLTTGLFHWSRTTSALVDVYKDGVLLGTANHGGSTLPTSIQIFSHNGSFSDCEVGLILIGDNLGDIATEIHTAWTTYVATL